MQAPSSPPTSSLLGIPPLPSTSTSFSSNLAGPEFESLVPTAPPTPARENAVIIPTTSFVTSLDASTMPIRPISPVVALLQSNHTSAAIVLPVDAFSKPHIPSQAETSDTTSSYHRRNNQHPPTSSPSTSNADTSFKRPRQPSPALFTPQRSNGTIHPPTDVEIDESVLPRLSAAQKGKGRAIAPLDTVRMEHDQHQPSQRIRKKPKMFGDYDMDVHPPDSAMDIEIDGHGVNGHDPGQGQKATPTPRAVNIDSEFIQPKPKPRVSQPLKPPSQRPNHLSAHQLPIPSTSNPTRPTPPIPKPPPKSKPRMSKPPSPAEEAYQNRLTLNALKPPLSDMKGPCPAWSATRKALQVAAEYLRDPVGTEGGSVDIGTGGIARGVILEGQARGGGFWGQDQEAGTVITSIGHSRKPTIPVAGSDPSNLQQPKPPPAAHEIPNSTISSSFTSPTVATSTPPSVTTVEEPGVAALILAQRARTPIAIAVTNDYTLTPFRVPRPFVVLGWFWVVDAWVKTTEKQPDQIINGILREGKPKEAIWMFRFDWCDGKQASPWWISKSLPDRPRQSTTQETILSNGWKVTGAGCDGPTTLRSPSDLDQSEEPESTGRVCTTCRWWSARIYAEYWSCLNVSCESYLNDPIPPSAPRTPCALRREMRISPEWLRLELRPPEPTNNDSASNYQIAGKAYWKGWVCKECGAANERRKWEGWDCEACDYHIRPTRRIYSDEYLRPPLRPVCTGPRQEDGHASFTGVCTKSWSLFQDHIKVIRYGLTGLAQLEDGAIYHALSTEAGGVHLAARGILKRLQAQGNGEVAFRRHVVPVVDQRVSEKHLSPFYTYLCGPETTPIISNLVTPTAVPWTTSPTVCLDAADLLNELAGRMFPGEKERFNSVLFIAFPPQLPSSSQPELVVTGSSTVGLLFLGSDGEIRIKDERNMKVGGMTTQHGDVIGVSASTGTIRITVKFEGFGFLCIGRQIYIDPTATTPSIQQSTAPPASKPVPKPRKSVNGNRTVKANEDEPSDANPIPPLRDWYIGPWPMDISQPLRVFSPIRELPDETSIGLPPEFADIDSSNAKNPEGIEAAVLERRYTGVEVVPAVLGTLRVLAPSPFESLAKKKKMANLGAQVDIPQPAKAKKPRTSKGGAIDPLDVNSPSQVDRMNKVGVGGARSKAKGRNPIKA